MALNYKLISWFTNLRYIIIQLSSELHLHIFSVMCKQQFLPLKCNFQELSEESHQSQQVLEHSKVHYGLYLWELSSHLMGS